MTWDLNQNKRNYDANKARTAPTISAASIVCLACSGQVLVRGFD